MDEARASSRADPCARYENLERTPASQRLATNVRLLLGDLKGLLGTSSISLMHYRNGGSSANMKAVAAAAATLRPRPLEPHFSTSLAKTPQLHVVFLLQEREPWGNNRGQPTVSCAVTLFVKIFSSPVVIASWQRRFRNVEEDARRKVASSFF